MKKKFSSTSLWLRRLGGGASTLGEEWLGQEKGEEEAGFIGCQLLVPGESRLVTPPGTKELTPGGITNRD
jgi:hypothetical protein